MNASQIQFKASFPGQVQYIEAFFENINWEEVNKRLEKAEAIAKLLKA